MKLLWLSFVDEGKFKGVIITEGKDVEHAACKCWKMGINPGGQVACFEIPETATQERELPRDTLLSEEFLNERGYMKLKEKNAN